MERDEMRASDADRQSVTERLKTALDEGRLDLHEYDDRLQKALAARTYGDLSGLLDDLPSTRPVDRSQVQPYSPPAGQPVAAKGPDKGITNFLTGYGGVVVVCFLIWAITSLASGDWIYPWPLWMLIPLVFGIIGRLNSRKNR